MSTIRCVAVVAAMSGIAYVYALLRNWAIEGRQRPRPGPTNSELGPEGPAVARLLVTRARVDIAAFSATVLDLVDRKLAEIVEITPGCDGVRLVVDDPSSLDEIGRCALDVLREVKADRAGIPFRKALGLRRLVAFQKIVSVDAQHRRLLDRVPVTDDGSVLVPSMVVVAALLALHGVPRGQIELVVGAGAVASVLAVGLVGWNRLGLLLTRGHEASAHWLGVHKYLAADRELCTAPARSIAIWGPYYVYAVALGVAHPTLRVLAPRVAATHASDTSPVAAETDAPDAR